MHLPQAFGSPFVVMACAGRGGQLSSRALACAPVDRCSLGAASTRSLTLTLTAAGAAPAARRGDVAVLASRRSA